MKHHLLLFLLSASFLTGSIYADEVLLNNGDRLTGRIVQLTEAKMIFKTDMAGQITIDLSNIETFMTSEPVKVNLKDGTAFNKKISRSKPGLFAVEGDETLTTQDFNVTAIDSINPPPKPVDKWKGDISAGITATRGNTVTDTAHFSSNFIKRTDKDRSLFSSFYIKTKQEDPDTGQEETSEDSWWLRGKYDYFISKKWFIYGDARYARDAIADLDRRVILGGGTGYQWVESDKMNFSTELGVASLYEKFDNSTESNSEESLQAGYHFDVKLNDKLKFINDLTYYPSMSRVSNYFLTTTAEIRATVTEQFFTNFKAILDYDTTPAAGKGNTDVKYLWGVGWNF
ncbi:MAG: DUF481 domain-containing protein [Planctomycetota bacterium]